MQTKQLKGLFTYGLLARQLAITCLCASCAIALGACSLSSKTNSTSLAIDSLNTPTRALSWNQIGKDPYVYRLDFSADSSTEDFSAFATLLKECGFKKSRTPEAATRQLLIGLQSLKLEAQTPKQIGEIQFLISTMNASLDGRPLELAVLSHERNDCVFNYVIWEPLGPVASSIAPATSSTAYLPKGHLQFAVGRFEQFLIDGGTKALE